MSKPTAAQLQMFAKVEEMGGVASWGPRGRAAMRAHRLVTAWIAAGGAL